jgi:glycosyltransferase involved in cell wall biosynthesis
VIRVALIHFCLEDYTIQLANHLTHSVDVTLIAPATILGAYEGRLDPSISVCSFEKYRIRDPRNFNSMRSLLQIIQEIQPNVVHVQETYDPWYDMTLLLSKMPPLVTTIHDIFRHPGDRQTTPGSEYTKRISYCRSRQLIVHTDAIRNSLIQQFHVPKTKLNVIPHGELGSLYQCRLDSKPLQRDSHTLLFFGRIWNYKGLKYLLEAIPIIQKQIPDIKLIVAGRGEDIWSYFPPGYDQTCIEILNDFIPVETVVSLFQRSTACVLPYIEASQSGVAALSYGLGTPVIASDVGGLREIVQHEKDGLLVPPRNAPALAAAIVRLLDDLPLQAKMRKAMFERCQQDLNWSNIANQTVEVYQTALAQVRQR